MIPLHVPQLGFKDLLFSPKEDYISILREQFDKNLGKNEVVFTSDGRNALYLALKLINLKRNDEILMPGYICGSVYEAVRRVCVPVYVDIDKKNFNMDPSLIEAGITKNSKALLVGHLYGNSSEMDKIVDIANDNDLLLVEDVAQALNGRYNNRPLGSFGDVSIFSFRFTKDITSLRGGALISNQKLNLESSYDSSFSTFLRLNCIFLAINSIKSIPGNIYFPIKKYFLHPFFNRSSSQFNLNYNTLSNYQCYLLQKQLNMLDNIINIRRNNAAYYSRKLHDVVSTPMETARGQHTYYRYTIQDGQRDELVDFLLKKGVEADKMYDYYLAPLPNSLSASENNLNIPVHHKLTEEDCLRVVEAIYEFHGLE